MSNHVNDILAEMASEQQEDELKRFHDDAHRNPVNHPLCQYCREWVVAGEYDHNRETEEVEEV